MSVISNHHEEYSSIQLKRWGMLSKAREEAIIDEYTKETDNPNQEIQKSIIHDWLTEKRINSKEELKLWQDKQGLNHEEWQEYLIRAWRWERWCVKKFRSEIPSYYLQRKNSLDQVSYSLIRVKTQQLANELFLRIKEKESRFSDVASEYSQGPEKHLSGFIGPVSMSKPHHVLARLLRISQPGQLWSPKQIDSWWVVVRLERLYNSKLNESISIKLSLELGEQHIQNLLKSSSLSKRIKQQIVK